jgi:plastocyanin
MRVCLRLCLLPLSLLAGSLLAGAASAQTHDWSHATQVEVDLWNFKLDPDVLNLQAGQPYVLHLVNKSDAGHNFQAKAFFAAAQIAPEDKAAVGQGTVDLAGNSSRDLHLVAPAAGDYEAHCSHFMHSTMGMKGHILVK